MMGFLIKTFKSSIENWLVSLLTVSGAAIGGWLLWLYRVYLKDWLLSTRYVEMSGWKWISLGIIVFLLASYFVISMLKNIGRFKNQGDIVSSLEDWFTNGDEFGDTPKTNTPYFFAGVDKSLNIKRGYSKKYLPKIAFKHGYAFQMGQETFTLTELTHQNDPTHIVEQHLKPLMDGVKEILLFCNDIDSELGWPKGAAKYFLLNERLSNANFAIEIKDVDGNELRINRKE
jgi:hypothetical protein